MNFKSETKSSRISFIRVRNPWNTRLKLLMFMGRPPQNQADYKAVFNDDSHKT